MDEDIKHQRVAVLERVRDSLIKVEEHVRRLQRRNRRLIYVSLTVSALATAIAGVAAAIGPVIGEGAPAWKATCGAVAVLTAVATVVSGVHQRFQVSDRLSQAVACAGRLSAMEVALSLSQRDPQEVAKEFEQVTATYREFIM